MSQGNVEVAKRVIDAFNRRDVDAITGPSRWAPERGRGRMVVGGRRVAGSGPGCALTRRIPPTLTASDRCRAD